MVDFILFEYSVCSPLALTILKTILRGHCCRFSESFLILISSRVKLGRRAVYLSAIGHHRLIINSDR